MSKVRFPAHMLAYKRKIN